MATKKSSNKTTTTKKTSRSNRQKKTKTAQLSKSKKQTKLSNTQRDKQLIQVIIEGMQEKKANNISIIDLTKIENNFCNYFVICEAESKPQLQAITDSIEETVLKKLSIKPHHIEGLLNAEWILLDYLTVIVHVFRSDIRDFYKIENLWADANIQYISNLS